MSHIGHLIDELATDGVPFYTVDEASVPVSMPGKVKREDYGIGTRFPIVDQSAASFVAGYTDDPELVVASGEYVVFGDHTRAVKLVDFAFAQGADGVKVLRAAPNLTTKWLYYCLSNLEIPSRGYNRHWTVVRDMRIPVPPLEVQLAISRVLDKFTELEAKLEAELAARRQQHNAYGDRLLRSAPIQELCGEGIERVPLGSVATQYVAPIRVRPDDTYINLGVRWYGEGAFARDPKQGKDIKGATLYRVKPGQFIYNRMFVTEGAFGLITPDLSGGVVSNEFPVYDLDTTRILPEWLFLTFQNATTLKAVAAEATGGTKSRRRWKEEQFEAFVVDLPPLSAQREMVRILSTFTRLRLQLEGELAARRRQYEYYRDKLLTFEETA